MINRNKVAKEESNRTEAAARNLSVGLLNKFILMGATFIVRTLFIRILGAEYTGISSLYSNILSLLGLAELGMGSVLTYELYVPLQERDNETVKMYVSLFRKIYLAVILAVTCAGIALIPFLRGITHSTLENRYLILFYLLYLLDSIASYFVVYRTTVIEADQKRYITQTVEIVSKLVMYLTQSVYLVLRHDFVGYLCIQVTFTVIRNVVLHQIAVNMYPFLRDKPTSKIEREKISKLFQNVRATFVTKLSTVVLTQTDSIIISALAGVIAVGYYSNYNMVVVYLNSFFSIAYYAIEASVGNLNAEQDYDKSYVMYKRLSLLFGIANAICVVGYLCIVQDFIGVWIGEEYIQAGGLVLSIIFTFYVNESVTVITMYRQTLGLFKETKRIYPIMAIINIILSVILGKYLGVAGVVLATGLSRLATSFWYEGEVVFKRLGYPMGDYLKGQGGLAIFALVAALVSGGICNLISLKGIVAILLKAMIVGMVVLSLSWIAYGRSEEWKWGKAILVNRLKNKR